MTQFNVFKSFTVFLIFLSIHSFAQFTFQGRVSDAVTNEALPGAHVSLVDSKYMTVTNVKGAFDFGNVKGGTYVLKVTFVGYKDYFQDLNVDRNMTLEINLEPTQFTSEEVIVSATRAHKKSPMVFTTIEKEAIQKVNIGKDLPFVLEQTPSVVTTSDAGAGVGYTGIWIRGTDISRINVTMNGVPVNDAESHSVFFVDLPDLASSIDNIQIQRGVGTSKNGAAAFGASINIETTRLNADPYAEINSMAGSFNTYKNTISAGSGLLKGKWAVDARYSNISSDGYIDRGWSKLRSFYLSGGYFGDKTIIKALVTSGKERTYQAWWGIPKEMLETDRTYNPSGEIYDDNGNLTGYFDDQTDNYRQDYYQLHMAHTFSRNLNITSALFYTRGIGYYESYRNNDDMEDYGFGPVLYQGDTIFTTDLVRKKWLDNHFYGFNASLNYKKENVRVSWGLGLNRYDGDHYGEITWTQKTAPSVIGEPWYENTGAKTDYHIFGRAEYELSKFNLYADLQYRGIEYSIDGIHDDLRDLTQSHSFGFFNPKAGVYYTIDDYSGAFVSVAVAHREPNRSVYRDADPGQVVKAEKLVDYEIGYRYNSGKIVTEINGYYMDYTDQLVLTGKINNVGDPVMVNVPESFRMGLEISLGAQIYNWLKWSVNVTSSSNKIKEMSVYVDDWTNGGQIASQLEDTDISFSPPFIAGSDIEIKPFKNFGFNFISRFVDDQYIDNTSSEDRKLDWYFVNDIRVNYTLKNVLFKEVDFMLSLNNIFSHKYESNAWVYRYYYDNQEYQLNGYFPQALFHFMGGVSIKL